MMTLHFYKRLLCPEENGDIGLTIYYRNISDVATYSSKRQRSPAMPILIEGKHELTTAIYCYQF